jgi:hypothetical protein
MGKLKSQKKRFGSVSFFRIWKNLVQTQLVAEIADAYFELLILDNELDFRRKH